MNKKALLLILLSSILAFSACSSSTNKVNWKGDFEVPKDIRSDFEKSIEENLATLKDEPENFQAKFSIAYSYDNMGEYKKAEKWYLEALELEPLDFAALNNIAALYETVGEIELAKKYIQTLYENYATTNMEVIRDSVRIFSKAGEPSNAQGILDTYIKYLGEEAQEETVKKQLDEMQATIDKSKTPS